MLNSGKYLVLFNEFDLSGHLIQQQKVGSFSVSGGAIIDSDGMCKNMLPIGPLTQSTELRIIYGLNNGFFEVRHEQSFRPKPLTKSISKTNKNKYTKFLDAFERHLGRGVLDVVVDRRYWVPGLAGYSLDGKKIYIDSRLPEYFKGVATDKYLIIHEVTEKALMDKLGFDYSYAHNIALSAEQKAVEGDGLNWDDYEKHMWDFIHAYSRAQQVPQNKRPPDLDKHRITHDRSIKDVMRHTLHKSNDNSGIKRCASIAVVHPETKSILMGRRNDSNAYTMPGGHINDKEVPIDGAKRELLEETGIVAKKLKYLGKNIVKTPKGDDVLVYSYSYEHPVEETDSEKDPDNEVQEWEWINSRRIKKINHHIPIDDNVTLNILKRENKLQKADKLNIEKPSTSEYESQKKLIFKKDKSITPQELSEFLEEAEFKRDYSGVGYVFQHPNHTDDHLNTVLEHPDFLQSEPADKNIFPGKKKHKDVDVLERFESGTPFFVNGKFTDKQISDLSERLKNNPDHKYTSLALNKLIENPNLSTNALDTLYYAVKSFPGISHSKVLRGLGSRLAAAPDVSEKTMMSLARSIDPQVRRMLAHNPGIDANIIQQLARDSNEFVSQDAKNKQIYHGIVDNPQSVVVSLGSNKARQIRDWIDAHGGEMHHKELKAAGLDVDSMNMSYLKGPQGSIKSDAVQRHINNLPSNEYYYSLDKYGFDPEENYLHSGHINQDRYSNLARRYEESESPDEILSSTSESEQRHSTEPSQVFQLNITPDHMQKMKQSGVWDTFLKLNRASMGSNHPVSPTHGIGWVRFTHKPDGIFIDEIQSDISQSVVKKTKKWIDKLTSKGDITEEGAKKHIDEAEQFYPEDHYKKINEILFGNKDATEVLHEGFNQYLRDNGNVGKPVHIWNAKGKANTIMEDGVEGGIPAHIQRTYDQIPKKMGYTPAKYGDISTQSNKETKSKWGKADNTSKTTLRKTEEYKDYIDDSW